jgi:nucleotide-binding universal stress UspA family protein
MGPGAAQADREDSGSKITEPEEIGAMSNVGEAVADGQTGRIVAGTDGSPGSLHALSWAGREARLRRATLEVVVAWTYPTPVFLWPAAPEMPEVRTLQDEARNVIERALAKVADDLAGVSVEHTQVEGFAAEVLLQRAKEADLLVVGSRGLGGFRGLLLGSVSQQCAVHAPCPVVVVPSLAAP